METSHDVIFKTFKIFCWSKANLGGKVFSVSAWWRWDAWEVRCMRREMRKLKHALVPKVIYCFRRCFLLSKNRMHHEVWSCVNILLTFLSPTTFHKSTTFPLFFPPKAALASCNQTANNSSCVLPALMKQNSAKCKTRRKYFYLMNYSWRILSQKRSNAPLVCHRELVARLL